MGVPVGRGVCKLDSRKRYTICVIDDEWDAVLFGDGGKSGDLFVGEDIASGVGGAGRADGCDVGGNFKLIKVDMVFEFVRCGFFDEWRNCTKQISVSAVVGIAQLFRDKGQQDFPVAAVGHFAGEEVEEKIECRLPTARDGDIFGP